MLKYRQRQWGLRNHTYWHKNSEGSLVYSDKFGDLSLKSEHHMHTYLTRVHGYHYVEMRQPQSLTMSWGPIQYHIRRLIVRSHKVSKSWDQLLKCSYDFEILRAFRQQFCRPDAPFHPHPPTPTPPAHSPPTPHPQPYPKFQSNCKTVTTDLMLSRLGEILRQDVLRDIEWAPGSLVARQLLHIVLNMKASSRLPWRWS